MIKKIFHYGISITGQLAQAVFNFGLFFVLIGFLSVSDLGLYSFIMMLTGLSGSLSNAMASTPISIYQSEIKATKTTLYDKMFCQVNNLTAIAFAIVTSFIAFVIYKNTAVILPIFAFNFLYFTRHFKRAYEFAKFRHQMATFTDLVYVGSGAAMLFGFYYYFKYLDITAIFTILSIALFFSIILGTGFLKLQIKSFDRLYLGLYKKIWKKDARWILLGVTTSEIIANVHSYLIMGIKGPEAFAPVTASQMPYRGIGIIQTAISSFERPRLVRVFEEKDKKEHKSIARFYYSFVMLALVSLVGLVSFFWDEVFQYVYKSKFDKDLLYTMFLIWGLVTLVRTVSSYVSLELQALQEFKYLGKVTSYCAVLSTAASLILLLTSGTAASIVGIMMGELLFLLFILNTRKKVLQKAFA